MEVSNHRKPLAINKTGIPFIRYGCLHVRDDSAPAASCSEGALARGWVTCSGHAPSCLKQSTPTKPGLSSCVLMKILRKYERCLTDFSLAVYFPSKCSFHLEIFFFFKPFFLSPGEGPVWIDNVIYFHGAEQQLLKPSKICHLSSSQGVDGCVWTESGAFTKK